MMGGEIRTLFALSSVLILKRVNVISEIKNIN